MLLLTFGEITLSVPKVYLMSAIGSSSFKRILLIPEVLKINSISPSVNYH